MAKKDKNNPSNDVIDESKKDIDFTDFSIGSMYDDDDDDIITKPKKVDEYEFEDTSDSDDDDKVDEDAKDITTLASDDRDELVDYSDLESKPFVLTKLDILDDFTPDRTIKNIEDTKGQANFGLKLVGVLSIIVAVAGAAFIGVLLYMVVISPDYDHSELRNRELDYSGIASYSDATTSDALLDNGRVLEIATNTDAMNYENRKASETDATPTDGDEYEEYEIVGEPDSEEEPAADDN